MGSEILRREVLKSFRNLHRARCVVFVDDITALTAARNKINEEYQKNKGVTGEEKIKELIQYANDVTTELRSTVVQIRQVDSKKFRLMLRPEVKLPDNAQCKDTQGNK